MKERDVPNTRVSQRPTGPTHAVRTRPAPRMSESGRPVDIPARATARAPAGRRRSARQVAGGPRPDRVAAWAVGLGIFMIFVAVATSKASPGPVEVHRSVAPAPIHALPAR